MPAPPAGSPGGALDAVLEWRVHLAPEQPGRAVCVAALILLVAAWAFQLFANPLAPLVAAYLLLSSTGEFLFPTTYRLSSEGAEARNPFCWRKIAWSEVKRVYVGEKEVKLSPLAYGGPREAFRGVRLRCPENQPAVLAAVERFRSAAATTPPRTDAADAVPGS